MLRFKSMFISLIALLSVSISTATYAATESGQIERVILNQTDSNYYFRLKGGCKGSGHFWYFDANTANGTGLKELVLSAAESGITVYVSYSSCSATTNETFDSIYIDY